jgi:hypothetical protein
MRSEPSRIHFDSSLTDTLGAFSSLFHARTLKVLFEASLQAGRLTGTAPQTASVFCFLIPADQMVQTLFAVFVN